MEDERELFADLSLRHERARIAAELHDIGTPEKPQISDAAADVTTWPRSAGTVKGVT
jgi:hypothetical protein